MAIRYDYARAYLAMFESEVAEARLLAQRHAEHPVTRWRERFTEMLAHLDEAEGLGDVTHVGDGLSAIAHCMDSLVDSPVHQ